jgi:hypothetical protein
MVLLQHYSYFDQQQETVALCLFTFASCKVDIEVNDVGAVIHTLRRAQHGCGLGVEKKICGQTK